MNSNELYHHGIKGQKWGVRRYQNEDGSLTSAGIKRYAKEQYKQDSKAQNKTLRSKAYSAITNGNKLYADTMYNISSKNANKKAAQQYLDSQSKSNKSSKTSKTSNKSAKQDRKAAVKNRRTLSDDELNSRINRLRAEKQLKDLTEQDVSPGKSVVKSVLESAGKKTATVVTTGAALYTIKYAITKSFDPKDLASYVAPKPKNK